MSKRTPRRRRHSNRPKAPRKQKSLDDYIPGLVISVLGKGYLVDVKGEIWTCRVRGRIFTGEKRTKPLVGDLVGIEPMGEPLKGIITMIEKRRSVLARTFPEVGGEQLLVANIDQVLICTALKEPPFRPALVDRYLVTCEALSLKPVILVNKIDLVSAEKVREILEPFESIGYETLAVSAVSSEGIDELKDLLQGRQSVLTGPSGVGKSSLVNTIQPGTNLKTGAVNEMTGKGRHTTTVTSLVPVAGGHIMDTPGIREFAPWGIVAEDLPSYFVEFAPFLGECRFRDCVHFTEPQCAVKEAVASGEILPRRYESYLHLREELLASEGE